MVRSIVGVIVGYIVAAVFIVACFTGMQLGLGTERVFQPGSYMASKLFIYCALGVTVVAAILGGLACAAISRGGKAPMVLAGLFLALGLFSAVMNMNKPDPGSRTGDISPFESALKARQPDWYAFTIPFLGAVGVLVGARLRKKA